MKIVKVCRDCGKYNSYKLYECAFCGANLEDDTIEVEDSETEVKKKVEEVVEEKTVAKEEPKKFKIETNEVRVCPICGYECTNIWCDNCGNYLEGIEVKKEAEPSSSVVSDLKFVLKYKNNQYEFNADATIKTLGRNDFDNIKDEEIISVSRKHLQYYVKQGNLYIKDISSYGTYLNGEKLENDKEYVVKNHSFIKLVFIEMECIF